MSVRRALACAVLPLLLMACGGDSSGPSASTPAGVWSLSFEGPHHDVAGNLIGTCHTEFVANIYAVTAAELPYQFETRIPLAAQPICSDDPEPRFFPEVIVGVRQEGDQLTFLAAGPTVLVTATYYGGTMTGTVPDRFLEYLGSTFQATRVATTTDPNAAPTYIQVLFGRPDLAVGDSLLITGAVTDGYGTRLLDEHVDWSSSDASVAGVETRGNDGFYGTVGRVLGMKPGTAYITARSGALADSLHLTVALPPPSASQLSHP